MTSEEKQYSVDIFNRRAIAKISLGFLVSLLLIYLIGAGIGWSETIDLISNADIAWIAIACLSTLICLAVWGKMWQVILWSLDVYVDYREIIVTFYAASFVNYITPMGQVGGEPFLAYLLSTDTEANYEQSLASIIVADLLRLFPFFNAAALGIGYLLLNERFPAEIWYVLLFLASLAVTVPVVMYVFWRYRDKVEKVIIAVLTPVSRYIHRIDLEELENRINRFYGYTEQISGSRRNMIYAISLAYIGWILFALPLYFSALALDIHISLLLVAFLVPVTVIVSFTPFPGGLGAIEASLVVLLGLVLAMNGDQAFAVTTIYRITSYWIVVGIGGLAALWVLARI